MSRRAWHTIVVHCGATRSETRKSPCATLVCVARRDQYVSWSNLLPKVLVVVLLLMVLVAVKSRRVFVVWTLAACQRAILCHAPMTGPPKGWKEHLCQMECTEAGASMLCFKPSLALALPQPGMTDKMIPHDRDLEAIARSSLPGCASVPSLTGGPRSRLLSPCAPSCS